MDFKFPKKEHLTGQKNIETLYKQGNNFLVFPFRVVFLDVTNTKETLPIRVMVSVSKKKFKRAVDRNRVKRLMRESYRLNKNVIHQFANNRGVKLHIAFQYISKEIESFQYMYRKMEKALQKMIDSTPKEEGAEQ